MNENVLNSLVAEVTTYIIFNLVVNTITDDGHMSIVLH